MDLEIGVEEKKKGFVIIDLAGDMDAYTSKSFRNVVDDLIKRRKYKLIVDIEKVTFIDSVGVGRLLGCLRKTREKKGDLWLVYHKSKAKKFLEVTGLNNNFTIFRDRRQAYRVLNISWSLKLDTCCG